MTVPWLDHTGVAYRAMDVLAFPSYREGLPNVPLEAQLCGVPVVGLRGDRHRRCRRSGLGAGAAR